MLDTFTIRIPGGPSARSIGPLINDKRGFKRKADGEEFAKGKEGGVRFLVGFSAASRASLSTLSSFRQTTTRHSIIRFLIFRDGSDRHQVELGLLSCCE